jgi:ABC-type cobalamin transport system permease subunit
MPYVYMCALSLSQSRAPGVVGVLHGVCVCVCVCVCVMCMSSISTWQLHMCTAICLHATLCLVCFHRVHYLNVQLDALVTLQIGTQQ